MTRPELRAIFSRIFLRFFKPIAAVVGALVLALGYAVVLDAKIADVRQASVQSLRQQQLQLTERQQYYDRLVAMAEQFQRDVSQADRDFVARAVPDGAQVPELLTALNAIAAASGGTVADVTIAEPTEATSAAPTSDVDELLRGSVSRPAVAASPATSREQILNVRFSLLAPGGYDTLRTFLDALETSDRLLNVSAIRFSLPRAADGPGNSGSQGQYDVTFTTAFLPAT